MITDQDVERAEQAVRDAQRAVDAAETFGQEEYRRQQCKAAEFALRQTRARLQAQHEQTQARVQAEQHLDESGALAAMVEELTAHDDAVTAFTVAAQQVCCDLADALRSRDAAIVRISNELTGHGLKLREGSDDQTGSNSSGVRIRGRWHLRVPLFAVLRALLARVEWARLGSRPPFAEDWRVVRVLERVPQPVRVDLALPPTPRPARVQGAPAYVRNLSGRSVDASTLTDAERAELERRDPKIRVTRMAPDAWEQMKRERQARDTAPDREATERGRG